MIFRTAFATMRDLFGVHNNPGRLITKACAPVVEELENRRLLSTVIYTVPAVDPTTSAAVTTVHLKQTNVQGKINVYLNSDTSFSFQFTGLTDTDKIDGGLVTGLTLIDEVPAALKPIYNSTTGAGKILFTSGGSGTL